MIGPLMCFMLVFCTKAVELFHLFLPCPVPIFTTNYVLCWTLSKFQRRRVCSLLQQINQSPQEPGVTFSLLTCTLHKHIKLSNPAMKVVQAQWHTEKHIPTEYGCHNTAKYNSTSITLFSLGLLAAHIFI